MTKRILVVEDQADNRQILRDMLSRADYEIDEAENGEDALAAVANQRPDLGLTINDNSTLSRSKSKAAEGSRTPKASPRPLRQRKGG